MTLLAYLLFAMGLALSGVFVIGGRLAGVGQSLAGRSGYRGSFFTGALAAVAATPCTAPFMGTAVGFAVTQPWTTGLLVFEALGLGLALPYLLLTMIPAWRRFLPRPGAWMKRLEELLAFPLYASVAWLVWVLSEQAGPTAVAAALAGLVLIGLAAWLYQASRHARAAWRRVGLSAVAALVVGAVALGPLAGTAPARAPVAAPGGREEAFSPRRLAELRAQGRPVFVNVTAAWCITCLVNERVALRSDAVAEAFAKKGVVVLKADWTNRDAVIAEMLGIVRTQRRPPLPAVCAGGRGQLAGPGPRRAPSDPHRGSGDRRGEQDLMHRPSTRKGDVMSEPSLSRRAFLASTGLAAFAAPSLARSGAAWAAAAAKVGAPAPAFSAAATTGKTGEPRRLCGQDRRAGVDEPRMPVREEALRDEQHAGAPEGGHRPGSDLAHDHLLGAQRAGLREREPGR